MAADSRTRTRSFRRWSAAVALLAASAFALLLGAVPSQAAPRAAGPVLVAAQLPDSAAGRQLRWLLEASARPPLSDGELRAHFSKWFLSTPGQSPAELNSALATVAAPGRLRVDRLTLVQPNAVVARVTGRDAQALVVSLVTDNTGRIDFGALRPAARSPQATLPAPTGRAAVGTDVVLASHGYLVLAVDHTGETPVQFPDGQFPDGHVEGRSIPLRDLIRTEAGIRLADLRLVLRRLNTLAPGPRADVRRVAAVGHSLGGSTAAAQMRAEPTVRAGVDLDGSIFGPARRRGVSGPLLVMVGGRRLNRSLRGLLEHSRGPLLALGIAGFAHFSFSDLPVSAPAGIGAPRTPSARDIALQRAYVRAFLDRYIRDRRTTLLDGHRPAGRRSASRTGGDAVHEPNRRPGRLPACSPFTTAPGRFPGKRLGSRCTVPWRTTRSRRPVTVRRS